MLVIKMFCTAGLSTALLMAKMREEAEKSGEEVDISAAPVTAFEENLDGVDVALLAPQAGYLKAKASRIASARQIPVEVMSMKDYGSCNGLAVLQLAKSLAVKD